MFFDAVPRVQGRTTRRTGALWTVAVVGVLILVAQTAVGHSLLRAAGISRQSASFAALAFSYPNSLPTKVPKSGHVPVEFSISSHGLSTQGYEWQVLEHDRSRTVSLATGRTVVASGGSTSIARVVHVRCARSNIAISVGITGLSAKIDLLLTC